VINSLDTTDTLGDEVLQMVSNHIDLLEQSVTGRALFIALALAHDNVGERRVDQGPVNKDLTRAVLVTVPEGHLRDDISSVGDSVELSVFGHLGDIGVLLAKEEFIDPVSKASVTDNGLTKSNNEGIVAVNLEVDSEQKGCSSSERVTGDSNLVVGILLNHRVELGADLIVGVVVGLDEAIVDKTVITSSSRRDVSSKIKVRQRSLHDSDVGYDVLQRVGSSNNKVDLLGGMINSEVTRNIKDETGVVELLDELNVGEVGTLQATVEGLEDLSAGTNTISNVCESGVLLKEVVGLLVNVRGLGRGVHSLLENCGLRRSDGGREGGSQGSAGCEEDGGKLHSEGSWYLGIN
jgi:hypothetical protein